MGDPRAPGRPQSLLLTVYAIAQNGVRIPMNPRFQMQKNEITEILMSFKGTFRTVGIFLVPLSIFFCSSRLCTCSKSTTESCKAKMKLRS